MARVTVEDCVTKVPNRFELVMLAAQRARELSGGAPLSVERDKDKNPVVALREIAEETIEVSDLQDTVISSLQRHVEQEEPEEDDLELLMRRELGTLSATADGAEEGAAEVSAEVSAEAEAEDVGEGDEGDAPDIAAADAPADGGAAEDEVS